MTDPDSASNDDRSTTSLEQLSLALTQFRERCLAGPPEAEPNGGSSTYESGWSLVRKLMRLAPLIASADHTAAQAVRVAVSHLGDLYRIDNDSVRRCIVDAILEHLFEKRVFIPFFESWQCDPVLRKAFDEASQWAEQLGMVRSLLEQLGPIVASKLQETGVVGLQIWPFETGSDILILEWAEWQHHNQSQLAVECADDLAAAVVAGYTPSPEQIERYGAYVINSENWKESEHLEGEFCVTIPLEL